MATERLFILLERLGNLTMSSLRTAGQLHALQPAPLLMLSYLAKANRYSDTPAAVAEFLGLSRAATSQSLALLEDRGLIRREQDQSDRRVWRLQLTPAGRGVVEGILPPAAWTEAAGQMSAAQAAHLEASLETLLRVFQRTNGAKSFGVCRSCRHFLSEDRGRYRCGLTLEPLAVEQIVRICREHSDPVV